MERAGQSPGWSIALVNNTSKHLFLDLGSTLGSAHAGLLPSQLISSPYLKQQRERRKRVSEDTQIDTCKCFKLHCHIHFDN